MKVLLIYPPTPDTFWSFKHVLRFVSKRAAFPPLGLLTVAGTLPVDWQLKLVDLNVSRLKDTDLRWADYVMISAMIVQKDSISNILKYCKYFGKPVIAGGPLFTTGHLDFPDIDHFVLGETEELMPQVIDDMRQGTLRHLYSTTERPDMTHAAIPRWDLIDMRKYVTMSVQFSRGCPFDCEFCDIIALNGHIPRTKSPAQMIVELDKLRSLGWKDMVFIVDDNFIGNKIKAKALLREIIHWRAHTRTKMIFMTEASANLADDTELCDLMVKAGFKKVFVGFETPSTESLQECNKTPNCNRDLTETVKILQRAGLEVLGGFIVGFDSDSKDIFKRQFEFIQHSGIVTAMVGLLTAFPETRLHRRLMKEGRLVAQSSGNNTQATLNFQPILDRSFLIDSYRKLMKELYEPANYYERITTLLEYHQPKGPGFRIAWSDFKAFLKSFWMLGVWYPGRRAFWRFVTTTLLKHPRQFNLAMTLTIMGHHFRRVAKSL